MGQGGLLRGWFPPALVRSAGVGGGVALGDSRRWRRAERARRGLPGLGPRHGLEPELRRPADPVASPHHALDVFKGPSRRPCRSLLQWYPSHFLQERLSLEHLSLDLYQIPGSLAEVPRDRKVRAAGDQLRGGLTPLLRAI